jgi:hypothetical protein
MIWVRILGAPLRQFYADGRARASMDSTAPRHDTLISAGNLASSAADEGPNFTVTLRNTSGETSRLYAIPPIGASLEVLSDSEVIGSGIITAVALDDPAQLTVQALPAVALPLRKTTVWGAFAEAAFIPHRYGVATGELVQYDDTRTVYCFADHACFSVDEVTVEGVAISDWQFANDIDPSGHPVALVRFGQPQDPSTSILATGRCKMHPVTGQVMENPADIMWDLLANIAGLPVSEAKLSEFRTDCDRLGLICGGSITDDAKALVRAREICASVGGLFCGEGRQIARVWPEGAAVVPSATIDYRIDMKPQSDISGIVNDLTLEFDFAGSEARQSIRYESPDSIATYGRMAASISAPWVGEARVAASVAARLLRRSARSQWVCTANGLRGRLGVGQAVTLNHPRLAITGDFLIQSAQNDFDTGLAQVVLKVPAGDPPGIVLTQQSLAFVPPSGQVVRVETIGSVRRLTIVDENGAPRASASVSLDGSAPRLTDSAGVVTFPVAMVPAGQHRIDIVTQDGLTLSATIVVG